MTTAVVTRNYQVTLPKEIRRLWDISIGESVFLEAKDEEVIIRKIKKDPVKSAFGAWRGRIKESSTEYVDRLRESWKDRHK